MSFGTTASGFGGEALPGSGNSGKLWREGEWFEPFGEGGKEGEKGGDEGESFRSSALWAAWDVGGSSSWGSFGKGSKDMGSSGVAPRESLERVAPECSEEFGNELSVGSGKESVVESVEGVSFLGSSLGSGKREFGKWPSALQSPSVEGKSSGSVS